MKRSRKKRRSRKSNPKRRRRSARRSNPAPRRRRRRRNPSFGPIAQVAIGAVGGIAAGLVASAILAQVPASGTVKTVVRGVLGAGAVVAGASLGHPILGAAAGAALALPTVRDTLRMIPGLEALPIGDEQIGAVRRFGMGAVRPAGMGAVRPAALRGVG